MNNPHTFTAIDFETAHYQGWSICQVGLIRVEQGLITEEHSWLVQPPDNYYYRGFTAIHGIHAEMTESAPTFNIVWDKMQPYIEQQHVVAHNGISFDFPVLNKTLQYYGMWKPDFEKHDTYRIYKKGLAKLCLEYDIALKHHDALSDARACALLFMMHLGMDISEFRNR